jgi:hypothetical protein
VVATYACAAVATVALGLSGRPLGPASRPGEVPADLTSANAVRGCSTRCRRWADPWLPARSSWRAAVGPCSPCAPRCPCSPGGFVVALPYDSPPPGRRPRRPRGPGPSSGVRDHRPAPRPGAGHRPRSGADVHPAAAWTVLVVVDRRRLDRQGRGRASASSARRSGQAACSARCSPWRSWGAAGLASWFGVGVPMFGAPLALLGVVPRGGGGPRPARPWWVWATR